MRLFTDDEGRDWVATAREEDTPRHHGRWYLVFHEADAPDRDLPMFGVRWKNRRTARRTLKTMSAVELKRRLRTLRARRGEETEAGWKKPAFAEAPAEADDA